MRKLDFLYYPHEFHTWALSYLIVAYAHPRPSKIAGGTFCPYMHPFALDRRALYHGGQESLPD